MKRTSFFGVDLEGFVDLHRTVQLQFSITCQGIDLSYCNTEWFALEMNRYHSVILRLYPRTVISDSFVDCDGYSISSKGFLPTVVDKMVI